MSSVRSFNSNMSTVLPYSPSVASNSQKDAAQGLDNRRNPDMHPLMLWFHKDEKLEKQYGVFYADRQLTTLRKIYTALLTIVGFVFGFQLDENGYTNKTSALICIALIFVCLVSLLVFSYTRYYRKWFTFTTVVLAIVSCVCFIHLTVLMKDDKDIMTIIIYLFSVYTFLLALTFPAVLLMHIVIMVTTMVDWNDAGIFSDSKDKVVTFFRLFCTSVLFLYAAYKNDYLFRRVFLSTYQLRTDNRDLRYEVVRLKQMENNKPDDIDLESPMYKVITTLKDIRIAAGTEGMIDKDIVVKLDAVIDTLVHNTDIFSPNIVAQFADSKKRIDGDVQSWVLSELTSKDSRPVSSSPEAATNRRSSLPSGSKRRKSSSGVRGTGMLPFSLRAASELQELDPDFTLGIVAFLDSHIDQWNFDSFAFSEKCNGRPLFHLANYLFKRYQLTTKFEIDPIKLDTFLKEVESTYHSNNPYHNSTHATDVLQSAHQLLVSSGVITILDDMEIMSVILACIIHDVDHPGRTNIFMVNSESDLSLLYNDKSVLENHHSSVGFRFMKDPKTNILDNMSKQERKTIRSSIIDLVLSTDLSQHFDIVGKFKSKLEAEDMRASKENLPMILKIIVKCADVSNPAKPDYIYQSWVDRIMNEFYIQGDEEGKLALPISPFMDRTNPTVEKCQCGFMDFIVKPLFEAYCNFSKDQTCVRILENNRQFYGKKLAALQPSAAPNPPPTQQTPSTPTVAPVVSSPPSPAQLSVTSVSQESTTPRTAGK